MSSPVTTIAEIGKHEGQSVTIRGWLYNLRESGKLLFPQFRDGSGIIQGVVPKNAVTPEVFDAIKTLTQESSVIVEGKVRADKRAHGGYELDVANVQVVQRVPESIPYPITPKEHGTDFLMEHRHLWVRSQRQAAILRVRAEIIKAARDFFDERGFTLTDPPIITPAACEGTSTLFPGRLLRRAGLPDAVRPALCRSDRDGAGQGVFLRPNVPRREIEDSPPSHRVLDGRAGSRLRRTRRRDGTGRGPHQLHREALSGKARASICRPSAATFPSSKRSKRRSRASATTTR